MKIIKRRKKKIKVPYVKQLGNDFCGAAALEMIYKFHGLDEANQEKIFDRYKIIDPEDKNRFRINTVDLVENAKKLGFISFWDRVNWQSVEDAIKTVKRFINYGIPIIVCQQSNFDNKIGHFRVVFGYDRKNIYLHDPDYGNKKNRGKFVTI